MQIFVEDDYNALGRAAARTIINLLQKTDKPLFCPTSGSTPAAIYAAMVQIIADEKIDVSRWKFVGLDEWAGMNANDAGSCRQFVDETFFIPLQIPENNICFFDGRAKDLNAECLRVETFLKAHGPLQVALVGLGLNGHVGMNEPGTPVTAGVHVAQIAAETQAVGQKYFTEPKNLQTGITLGLHTLLQAENILLAANGSGKAAIVKKIVDSEETENLPATFLKRHPHFYIYLDNAAASHLT